MTAKALCLVPLFVAAVLLTGCGSKMHCPPPSLGSTGGSSGTTGSTTTTNPCGTGSIGASAALVYFLGVDSTGATAIGGANLSTSGTLTALPTTTTTTGVISDDMAIVSKQFLYIPFGDTNAVEAYSINHTTGVVTAISTPTALTSPATADAVVSDPQGRFLFIGGEGTGSLSVFQISSTGSLTQSPGSPYTTLGLSSADSMAVDGGGKFLYVAQLDSTLPTAVFTIDQTSGDLTPAGEFALGVAQIHADSSGKYLLGVAQIQDQFGFATDPHISVFSIDPNTGAPSAVGTPFMTTAAPFDFAISPNAQFVYTTGNAVTGTTIDPIEGYMLNGSTGALSALPGSPFVGTPPATQCKFDQGGGVLMCATASGLSVFTANPTTGTISHGSDLVSPNYPFAVTD